MSVAPARPVERRPLLAGAIWRMRAIVKPPVTLGVRALVIAPGGEVLLVRHTYMPGFHLPGGAVDPGESAREAMRREVREESGLSIDDAGDLFHLYWNRRLAGRDHVALFVVRLAGAVVAPRFSSAEIAESGFHAPGSLPADTTESTRRRRAEVLSGEPISDVW